MVTFFSELNSQSFLHIECDLLPFWNMVFQIFFTAFYKTINFNVKVASDYIIEAEIHRQPSAQKPTKWFPVAKENQEIFLICVTISVFDYKSLHHNFNYKPTFWPRFVIFITYVVFNHYICAFNHIIFKELMDFHETWYKHHTTGRHIRPLQLLIFYHQWN